MLSEVNIICKSLQKRCHTLEACQNNLDVLLDTVSDMKVDRNLAFQRYKMDEEYISEKLSVIHYPNLEPGVVKIQFGKVKELT